MSTTNTGILTFRTRFMAPASALTEGTDGGDDAAGIDCGGGCIRGALWAMLLEGAGVLALGCLVHVLRAFHG